MFRWSKRYSKFQPPSENQMYDWKRHMAEHGYLLLSAKSRNSIDRQKIKSVIESKFGVGIDESKLFELNKDTSLSVKQFIESILSATNISAKIIWTTQMLKLALSTYLCVYFDVIEFSILYNC